MKVQLSSYAARQLREAIDYYRGVGALRYASKLEATLRSGIGLLAEYPELGAVYPPLASLRSGHRSLILASRYRVVYRLAGDVILVSDVFDTRQDPARLRS